MNLNCAVWKHYMSEKYKGIWFINNTPASVCWAISCQTCPTQFSFLSSQCPITLYYPNKEAGFSVTSTRVDQSQLRIPSTCQSGTPDLTHSGRGLRD